MTIIHIQSWYGYSCEFVWHIYISGCLELVKYAISWLLLFKHWRQTQSYVHCKQAPHSELHRQCLKQVIFSFYFVSKPIPSLGKKKKKGMDTVSSSRIWGGAWLVLLLNFYLMQTLLARDHSLRTWSHSHTRGSEEHTGGPRTLASPGRQKLSIQSYQWYTLHFSVH